MVHMPPEVENTNAEPKSKSASFPPLPNVFLTSRKESYRGECAAQLGADERRKLLGGAESWGSPGKREWTHFTNALGRNCARFG